jgi:hypothetical protein
MLSRDGFRLRSTHPAVIIVFFAPITWRRYMTLTAAHISPLVALIAGILILIVPRLLNYIVALYLILIGIMGLNEIHGFFR